MCRETASLPHGEIGEARVEAHIYRLRPDAGTDNAHDAIVHEPAQCLRRVTTEGHEFKHVRCDNFNDRDVSQLHIMAETIESKLGEGEIMLKQDFQLGNRVAR